MTTNFTYGVVAAEQRRAMTGLELLRGIIAGVHPMPPFSRVTNMRLVEAEEGRVVFAGEPGADFLNPLDTIHGGWAATILDSAMACAVFSTTRAGESSTTIEMKLNYVRPLAPDCGRLTCEGRILHRGRVLGTSEGRLLDQHGRLVAHGTETCMFFAG
jgi:uncharacterized protein (TIGR00369 family)